MNDRKRIELLRKKNKQLTEELEGLRFAIKHKPDINNANDVDALVVELESIKDEWLTSLEELKKKNKESDNLITELKMVREQMSLAGFRLPYHKKIILRLKKFIK